MSGNILETIQNKDIVTMGDY